MRIRNLYNPPTLKDYPVETPWTPDGTTCEARRTDQGWEFTATNPNGSGGSSDAWGWTPSSSSKISRIEMLDGSIDKILANGTFRIDSDGKTHIYTRICGFDDLALPGLLESAGLPLVFAAGDHPY